MKKVLIITYYWPPSGGSGVQRWLKFSKYLSKFDWKPIIYTPENPENPIVDDSLQKDIKKNTQIIKRKIWEPYSFYKKFIGKSKNEKISAGFLSESKKNSKLESISVWIRGNLFIPDARKFWIKPSIKYLNKYLSKNNIDLIISTGPPHSMHLIAEKISIKNNIPWIADFRDPWTEIDFYHELKLSKKSDRKHRRLEKSVLINASRVVVISQGMADSFTKIHPRNYNVIYNGFDTSDIAEINIHNYDKFSISHLGSLVPARNPSILWQVLNEISNENPNFKNDLEIQLVGKTDFRVIEEIKTNSLFDNLKQIDYLPHSKISELQQKSFALLLLINNTPNAKMILTGKFFEYMSANRPIICIGPENGDAAKIIQETECGYTIDFDNKFKTKEIVLKLYNEFKSNLEFSKSKNIEEFTRENLTKKYSELMNSIID